MKSKDKYCRLIIGIDPGKRGAVAAVDLATDKATVMDMPEDETELIELLVDWRDQIALVAIEKQQPYPKQGISSTFSLAKHYGILIGILKALSLPFEEVPPRRWQKRMLGNGSRSRAKSKKQSLAKARALFPEIKLGNKHGRSDALLIAEWARRERYGFLNKKQQNEM